MPRTRAKVKADPYEPYRTALMEKQQEMVDTYFRDRAAGAELPEDGIQDLADKAASAYSRELNFSLSDTERQVLVRIREALERLEDGEYGACTNCGQTIGEKRLKAIPWTPFCIDCAELKENGLLVEQ